MEESGSPVVAAVEAAALIRGLVCSKYIYPHIAVLHVPEPFGLCCGLGPAGKNRLGTIRGE